MAKFNFKTEDERKSAIRRAEILKPNVPGVYASDRGYVVDRPNGTTEILVSFHDLDALLSENENVDTHVVVEDKGVPEVDSLETVKTDSTEPANTEKETKEERRARRKQKDAE